MKILTVDFTNDVPVISTRYGGELGEHQAVSLNIIPEKSMTEDEDLQFYYVLFKVDGGLVASRTFSQGEDIEIALWGQLTENRRLSFQLIGTNGTETIIAKTPILTLSLGDSLVGTVIGIDDNRDSLIAMIGAFNERVDDVEEKLDTIETGAEVNVIESIKTADDVTLPISNKTVTLPEAVEVFDRDGYLKYTAFQMRDMKNANKQLLFKGQPIEYLLANTTYSYFLVPILWDTLVVYRINSSSSPYTYFYEYDRYYLVRDKNAERNKINAIKKADGTTIPIVDGAVTLPNYALVSALTDYYTKLETYSKTEVDNLIGQISALSIEIVQTLPTQDIKTNVIYLVPKTGSTNDVYDEYMYINNAWEHIGSTDVDLSNYYTKTEIDNKGYATQTWVGQQGYLTSIPTASTSTLGGVKVDGSTITISDGVISSSNTPIEINDSENTGHSLYTKSQINQFLADGKQVTIYGNPIISYDVAIGSLYATLDLTSDGDFIKIYTVSNAKVINDNSVYKLADKGTISANSNGYVTGGQVYSEGYLKSIPTASTSTLGGVKVDGTSISIDANGVISSSGGGGASAFVVTFSMQGGGLVADKTIAEIYEAYDDGNIVIGTMTQNGISYVFSLVYIAYAEGDSGAAYFSSLNNNGSPIIIQCIGTYNGSTDSWSPIMASIPSAGQIQSGDTGYATGGDVYTALSSKQDALPSGTNTGDMLVWANSQWSAQSIYGIKSDANGYYIEV